jgi:sulfite exporter TauE/SafE
MQQYFENIASFIIVGSFGAGLLSSLHCLGMCGPLMAQVRSKKSDLFIYHGLRLVSYLIIALLFSLTGKHLLKILVSYPILAISLSVLLAAAILLAIKKNSYRFQNVIFKNVRNKAAAFGLMSGFLPCGPLYAVVLSTSMLSPTETLFYMLLFWAGTLPLVFSGNWLIAKIKERFSLKFPAWSGIIVWGLFVILAIQRISFNFATQSGAGAPTCH